MSALGQPNANITSGADQIYHVQYIQQIFIRCLETSSRTCSIRMCMAWLAGWLRGCLIAAWLAGWQAGWQGQLAGWSADLLVHWLAEGSWAGCLPAVLLPILDRWSACHQVMWPAAKVTASGHHEQPCKYPLMQLRLSI